MLCWDVRLSRIASWVLCLSWGGRLDSGSTQGVTLPPPCSKKPWHLSWTRKIFTLWHRGTTRELCLSVGICREKSSALTIKSHGPESHLNLWCEIAIAKTLERLRKATSGGKNIEPLAGANVTLLKMIFAQPTLQKHLTENQALTEMSSLLKMSAYTRTQWVSVNRDNTG